MHRHAIAHQEPMVKAARELKTLRCPVCRKRFKQKRWWQKQCSTRCTDRAYKLRQIEKLREQIRAELAREEKAKAAGAN